MKSTAKTLLYSRAMPVSNIYRITVTIWVLVDDGFDVAVRYRQ